MVAFNSFGNGKLILSGAAFWGLAAAVGAGRINSGSWLDVSGLSSKPSRTLSWFLIGASISVYVNVRRLNELGYNQSVHTLHTRVAENEHAHAILRNAKFHVTRRQMGIWGSNPQ